MMSLGRDAGHVMKQLRDPLVQDAHRVIDVSVHTVLVSRLNDL